MKNQIVNSQSDRIVTIVLQAALFGYLAYSLSGCAGMSTLNQDFTLTGSAEGIKQFYTGLNGTIKEGKQSGDAPSQYLAFRGEEEQEITKRNGQLSFWDKLAGNSEAPTPK